MQNDGEPDIPLHLRNGWPDRSGSTSFTSRERETFCAQVDLNDCPGCFCSDDWEASGPFLAVNMLTAVVHGWFLFGADLSLVNSCERRIVHGYLLS